MRPAVVLCIALGALIAGCGGLAEERADPAPREGDELQAREWHDRVVRLEGEASVSAARGDACDETCSLAARACELTDRICALAASDELDEGTRVLCEDARPRCASARASGSRASASQCTCVP